MSVENKPLPIIEVVNLKKRFGRIHALKGISFSIGKGEIVGFLGPNGAGKSSLMRTIASLQEPSEGSITFNDVDIISKPQYVR